MGIEWRCWSGDRWLDLMRNATLIVLVTCSAKLRGKGAPKKKRTAEESKKFQKKKR